MDQELNIFDIFDIDGNDLLFNAQQAAWDKLIDEIVNGNVIPLIGPDILIESGNVHKKIVEALAKKFRLSNIPSSFSELVYDHDFLKQVKDDKKAIYGYMNMLFSRPNVFRPSSILKELISIKQFPFIIITSFTPIAEEVMREVWGDELRVLKFNNNPSENDDILSETDLRKPTIYYMFGKVGDSANRYVLTDNDMLAFCTSWLNEGKNRPNMLTRIIKNKYLLMLGNNYSDWLFRFIWYSIRNPEKSDGLVVTENIEDELSQFLERNHTFICNNPQDVIQEIKDRLPRRLQDLEKKKFDSVERGVDVFISYSRSDIKVAEELYNKLTAQGKKVWFDKKNISSGGDFRNEIKEGIQNARYFIPILSKNVEKERKKSHYYRLEWDDASQMAISLGRTFIIPLTEENFSYKEAAVDERIQRYNAIEYSGLEDIENAVQKIIHIINNE